MDGGAEVRAREEDDRVAARDRVRHQRRAAGGTVGSRGTPPDTSADVALELEFLLAGLLRLSAVDDFRGLAVVAAIVALRKLISTGIGLVVRAFDAHRIGRIRA